MKKVQTDTPQIKVRTVVKASELLKQAQNGDFTFEHAFQRISELDISGEKKEDQSLTLDIAFMLFAGTKDTGLKVASIGGNEVLIDKRAIDEFTKTRLLWKLKMKEIEVEDMKRVVDAYEGALERYGHFNDTEDSNEKDHEEN